MNIFGISDLVGIIVDYVSHDVICDNILSLDWPLELISKLEVSYLSHIVNNHPDKINECHLATNPRLTPDLIAKIKHRSEYKINANYFPTKFTSNNMLYYNEMIWKNPNIDYMRI